jgi:hypothetical protein
MDGKCVSQVEETQQKMEKSSHMEFVGPTSRAEATNEFDSGVREIPARSIAYARLQA